MPEFQLFARRLAKAMLVKGWDQSEMARRADACLPPHDPQQKRQPNITRDNINKWVNAIHLPTAVYLQAVADALGMAPEELLPGAVRKPSGARKRHHPFKLSPLPDGNYRMEGERVVTWQAARAITDILVEDQKALDAQKPA